jgi:hypothetical protein
MVGPREQRLGTARAGMCTPAEPVVPLPADSDDSLQSRRASGCKWPAGQPRVATHRLATAEEGGLGSSAPELVRLDGQHNAQP